MDSIRAFVGYSFAKKDEPVVSSILKMLTRISEIHPNFKWEDAKHPEPRLVDEKVLALFEDKNVFIGICTAKERAIENESLTTSWFPPGRLWGAKAEFDWKTSDWLIQEIGVALGRGMKIILLIESSVRPPGAMQGNLEYVPFNRAALTECYDELMGMIAKLSPKSTSTTQTATEPSSAAPEKAPKPPADEGKKFSEPRPDWDLSDYEFSYWQAEAINDLEATNRIDEAFLGSRFAASDDEKISWQSHKLFSRVLSGKAVLPELKELAASNSDNAKVWADLGGAYVFFEEWPAAVDAYLRAAKSNAAADHMKIRWLAKAAELSQKFSPSRGAALMNDARRMALGQGDFESDVLQAIGDSSEGTGEEGLYLGAYERLVELDPSDAGKRFALAYKYSQEELYDLAAYHYAKIPESQRSGMAWNNFGVSLGELKLPISMINAYRESERKGETLAMSNLANKFLEAGFLSEARGLLERAAAKPKHHRNVDHYLSQLKDRPDAESKKESETFDQARKISDFFRQFGRASALPLDVNLTGAWQTPQAAITVAQELTQLSGVGTFEQATLGALGTYYLGLGQAPPPPTMMKIDFEGAIYGRSIVGTVRRREDKEDTKTPAMSLLGDPLPSVLMFVEDDNGALSVLERSAKRGTPNLYRIVRRVG